MNTVIRDWDGLLIPAGFPEENFQLIKTLPLRTGDIFLTTYPKCGTNWLAYITWMILKPEEPAPEADRVQADCVFVDLHGFGRWTGTSEDEGRTMVTHLPYDRVSNSACAKYVVVIRNPLDCCVSMYHFARSCINLTYTEDEGQEVPSSFFDEFASGKVGYGDFFSHLHSWYAHKDDPNVHLVVFEKMKEDPREEILKLAKFLGHEHILHANDGRLLDKIVKHSSFGVMKENLKYTDRNDGSDFPILRKGESGGYRNALTQSQIDILKRMMEIELKGTEILEYWRNI